MSLSVNARCLGQYLSNACYMKRQYGPVYQFFRASVHSDEGHVRLRMKQRSIRSLHDRIIVGDR